MNTYRWAAGPDKIASEIMSARRDGEKYLEQSGMLGELRKSYRTFYGSTNIKEIDQSLQAIHINHYANLVRHVHVDVTSQRPAWEPRAANTDMESQADTQLATGLLDFCMREKHIESILNSAVEKALFLREGWVSCGWNVSGGEIHDTNPDDGRPIMEGDIEIDAHTLPDVTRDVRRRDMNHQWFIVRRWKNKWDLCAKYPDLADKIAALTIKERDQYQYEIINDEKVTALDIKSELIPEYTLYHEKTPAIPQGRLVTILSDEILLFDGPLPYKKMYIFPATPSPKIESGFGHSYLFDLLPIQDAFNATVSAILTNQAANAVQNFQAPKGAAPKVTAVKDGLNVWEYDPKAGKLESMDLLKTAPEVFNFAEFLKSQKELIAGVSQIARGNAPATMSGTAMALLAQQAMEFSNTVQLSRTLLLENVGTAIIELYQTFAVVPRVMMIVGKSKRPMMRYFKGSDLRGISRVIVDTANPLTKTSAGRVEIANQLLATPNMIKTPQQYLSVLTTGNLEPIYEHELSENNLIRSENEWLMEGKTPEVLITDDDALHVLEHACIANSPEARENPKVLEALFSHQMKHIQNAKSKDPALATMLKQPSFFQPPMPAMAPMPQGPGLPPAGPPPRIRASAHHGQSKSDLSRGGTNATS